MKRHRSAQVKIICLFILLEVVARLAYSHITAQVYDQDISQGIKEFDADMPALLYDAVVTEIHRGNSCVSDYIFNQVLEKYLAANIQLAFEWDLSIEDFTRIDSRLAQMRKEASFFKYSLDGVTIFVVDHNEKERELTDDLYGMIVQIYYENDLHGNILVKVHDINEPIMLPGVCLTCTEYAKSDRQILNTNIPCHEIHIYADLEYKPVYQQRAILEHAMLHCQQFHRSTIKSVIASIEARHQDMHREELIQSASFIKYLRSLERFADRLPAAVKDLNVVHMMEKYYTCADDEQAELSTLFYEMREKKESGYVKSVDCAKRNYDTSKVVVNIREDGE